MITEKFSDVDKSTWGPGAWQDEPDKAFWVDPETGLDCLVVRNPMGALCGYVGVKKDHPLHGVGYSEHVEKLKELLQTRSGDLNKLSIFSLFVNAGEGGKSTPDLAFEVHGGITFSDECQPGGKICHPTDDNEKVWWFGFDCGHHLDLMPKFHLDMKPIREKLGHDHNSEIYGTYKDFNYVKSEIESLAKQLKAVS